MTAAPPDFLAWLKTAHTEEGPFPDWPYVWEYAAALQSGENIVLLKERQILASWIGAAYAHYTAAYHAGHHVGVVSAGLFEAEEFARKIGIVARGDGFDVKGVRRISYQNGSQILIFPATETAGISFTLKLALLDEFSMHPYGATNLAAIGRSMRKGEGQLVVFSTSHPGIGATGAFYNLYTGDNTARKLFLGRGTRPDRGDAWYAEQRAEPGVDDHAMAAYHPRTPDEAFSAAEGLLFGQEFDRQRNVAAKRTAWKDCRWRVVSLDLGGEDPTVLAPVGVTQNLIGPLAGQAERARLIRPEFERMTAHVYAPMYYRRGIHAASAQEIDAYLWSVEEQGHIDLVPVDAGSGTAGMVATLQALGWPALPAHRARLQGFGLVGQMLASGRLTIEPENEDLIHEFLTTFHKPRRDMTAGSGEMPLITPQDHHADGLDAVRYAIAGILFTLPAMPQGLRVELPRDGAGHGRMLDERRLETNKLGAKVVMR